MVRRTWVFACLVDQPTTHSIFAIVFSIVCFFTGNRPGPLGYFLNPIQRYNNFPKNQKFFFNFYTFFEKSCIFYERFRKMTGIFVLVNLKNQSLCLYKRQMAVGVGANTGKCIQPKPKRKRKAAPHTPPDTVKSQQQTKRNREFPQSPKFPYLCCVFLPIVSPNNGILTAPPGFVRAGFLFPSSFIVCETFIMIRRNFNCIAFARKFARMQFSAPILPTNKMFTVVGNTLAFNVRKRFNLSRFHLIANLVLSFRRRRVPQWQR